MVPKVQGGEASMTTKGCVNSEAGKKVIFAESLQTNLGFSRVRNISDSLNCK